ncbi:GNAT family N-acetyltransferase [Paenibacillus sp. NPDC056579]|uniref:GNAT family N-acetyltransferase n=1 Tax=Paenibacillus sp. NPDC056579 TaxID=3345871 RepID=UPI0036A4A026
MGSLKLITIRDAGAADEEAVRQLMLGAYEQYAAVLPPARWEAYRESIASSAHGDGPIARIVAEIEGEIVGSVQLFDSSLAAYGRPELDIRSPIIRLLSVSPQSRGLGIATELIKESVRRCLALKASALHLHTSDMMQSAVRLYERLGFERAADKDIRNGDALIKGYRLLLNESILLQWQERLVGQEAAHPRTGGEQ